SPPVGRRFWARCFNNIRQRKPPLWPAESPGSQSSLYRTHQSWTSRPSSIYYHSNVSTHLTTHPQLTSMAPSRTQAVVPSRCQAHSTGSGSAQWSHDADVGADDAAHSNLELGYATCQG